MSGDTALGSESSNADRYLDAFGRIESELRVILGSRQGRFRQKVERAAERNASFLVHKLDLIEFSDLRNAIVHERDGDPLADPRLSTVERIEAIADLVCEPPRIGAVAATPVSVLAPHEAVDGVVHRMRETLFSQMPVYDGTRFVGLLTAATVVWWLAASDNASSLSSPIVEVLPFTEAPETHVRFLAKSASVFDGIRIFEQAVADGLQVDAVFVTESGSADEVPIGILTVSDLPAAYRTAGVRR